MRKLLQLFAAAALSFGALGATAAAQQSGSLDTTGPGSTNTVTNTTTNTTTLTCDNTAGVANINFQGSSSGNANANNNTTSGNVTSGSANNANATSTNIDQSCGPVAKTATSSTSTTPAGGQGAGAVASASVAALPKTGANPLAVSSIIASVLGAGVAASRFGVSAFKRFTV